MLDRHMRQAPITEVKDARVPRLVNTAERIEPRLPAVRDPPPPGIDVRDPAVDRREHPAVAEELPGTVDTSDPDYPDAHAFSQTSP